MWLLADGPVSLSDGMCAFWGNDLSNWIDNTSRWLVQGFKSDPVVVRNFGVGPLIRQIVMFLFRRNTPPLFSTSKHG